MSAERPLELPTLALAALGDLLPEAGAADPEVYWRLLTSLRELSHELPAVEPVIVEALALTERCLRLARDRQQLSLVQENLGEDESARRQQLLELLGRSTASAAEVGPRSEQRHHSDSNPGPGEPNLSIWLLGQFKIAARGRLIVGTENGLSSCVLRFLAAAAPGAIHKEVLASQFWPDSGSSAARRNLHQAIYTIRRMLSRFGAEPDLVFVNDHYRLGVPGLIWRDVDELTHWVDVGRVRRREGNEDAAFGAFQRADLVYTGPFLDDHPYDDWVQAPREHYRSCHREAAAALLGHHAAADDPCAVLQVASRLLSLDPSDEDACRHLMRAHAHLGQSHLAMMAFTTQAAHLRDVLGVEPCPESLALALALSERRVLR